MTSSPLLKSVAESIVTFLPMFHTGCFNASSALTFASWLVGTSLSAPPLAVSTRLLTHFLSSPLKHEKIAECSVSRGKIFPPYFFSRALRCLPAQTMVSLFAIASVPPLLSVATAAQSPAIPETADTTMSAGMLASSSSDERHFDVLSSSKKSKSEL